MSLQQEMITISRKEYTELLEEVGILHDPEMMAAIHENDDAKKKGIKTSKLKF